MRNPFKRKRYRGKSKSPETKLKEKKARVDVLLLDSWMKQLKNDPELAARIAEQKYGSETVLAYGADGEYREEPDLLAVLRQAREAKELIQDELGMSRGSTIKDIAEILKALPGAFQALGQINPVAVQQPNPKQITQQRFEQIAQPEPEQPSPNFNELKLERIMGLLELEPQQAWENLKAEGETDWIAYLKSTTYEQLVETLNGVAKANPEYKTHIEGFIKQYHEWLQDLILIAHKDEEK